MVTAKRPARVVLGVLVLAGIAICQTKSVRVLEPARRLALVIGNAAYVENRLVNPEGDAELIETTLEGLGFDEVVLETNLETLPAMVRAVRAFGERLTPNDLAFFYYSGHGQQAPGGDRGETRNYLLPTGYDWKTPKSDVEFAALPFERVRQMLKVAQLRVLVLDACRKYKQGKSGGAGGLAPTVAARGELIAYATEADAVATDDGAGAGIYAQELAWALRQPGLEVGEVFRNVMAGVDARTGGAQHPEHMPKIVGRLYLNGLPMIIDSRQPWIGDWQELEGIKDPAMRESVEAYIENYKDEPRAREEVAEARMLLAELTKKPETPSAGTAGVVSGVPGGGVGGTADSVLGSIISSSLPPPPPAPPPPPVKKKLPTKRIRVGGNVAKARLVSQVRPRYPPLARQARIQGTVKFSVVISKDGSIQKLEVMSGHPLLVPSAMAAVKQWRYEPTLLNGEAVEILTNVDVNFTLIE